MQKAQTRKLILSNIIGCFDIQDYSALLKGPIAAAGSWIQNTFRMQLLLNQTQ